jgi:DNA-binding NtrC family response regulator
VERQGVRTPVPATVLVLDESAAVQDLIEQALRERGHRVLSTKDAPEALHLARRVRIDVAIVGDLLEARSEALVRDLLALQPALRIISISGPDDDARNVNGSASLFSPLSLDELCESVAVAVSDQRGG